jgi:hypothetical protein
MPPGIGYSFQPGSSDIPMQGGASGGAASAPASAVKVLSMRVPKRAASSAIAPQALLQSPGSAGAPGGFDPMLLQLLMKAFAPPQTNGVPNIPDIGGDTFGAGQRRERQMMDRPTLPMQEPGALPPPRIIPGDTPQASPELPEPPPLFAPNPWAEPGRNPKLADKYSMDSFGHDIQPLF